MQTLTYGLKLPDTGDKGSVFFPALEDNIVHLNAHDHNGINSVKIDATGLIASTLAVPNGSWVLVANGIYRQLLTLPVGMDFSTKLIKYTFASGALSGQVVFPREEKVTTNTYYVYLNDNTVDLTAAYL